MLTVQQIKRAKRAYSDKQIVSSTYGYCASDRDHWWSNGFVAIFEDRPQLDRKPFTVTASLPIEKWTAETTKQAQPVRIGDIDVGFKARAVLMRGDNWENWYDLRWVNPLLKKGRDGVTFWHGDGPVLAVRNEAGEDVGVVMPLKVSEWTKIEEVVV